MSQPDLAVVLEKLDHIAATLANLLRQRTERDWYVVEEVAELLNRRPFTVREWCRLGRLHAEKKGSGRGKHQSWVISHTEVLRFQRQGLLPVKRNC